MSLGDPASAQGLTMRGDWYVFAASAAVVFVIVCALIIVPLVVWREREGRRAASFSTNPPLEIFYTVVPLAIVTALFIYTFRHETIVDRVAAHPEQRIDVTAYRWSWQFAYSNPSIVSRGTPFAPPTLYLPVNQTTEIALRSLDVNHSFWLPDFLFKRDAIPGMTNTFDLTPTRLGRFTSKCAQFCGLDHALMTFTVDVVPARAFRRFINSNGTVKP